MDDFKKISFSFSSRLMLKFILELIVRKLKVKQIHLLLLPAFFNLENLSVNRQLNDKERVAAAMENSGLVDVVTKWFEIAFHPIVLMFFSSFLVFWVQTQLQMLLTHLFTMNRLWMSENPNKNLQGFFLEKKPV